MIVATVACLFLYIHDFSWEAKAMNEKYALPYPAIISHRGASGYAPEATIPAFLLAYEIKTDYWEFDVQRSKDGVLIVYHDDFLKRNSNVAEVFPDRVDKPVGDFTFEELQKLDIGSWFNAKYPKLARKAFAGLKILALKDVLTLALKYEKLPGIYLESKSPELYPGIEEQIVSTFREVGWIHPQTGLPRQRVVFQSFAWESLQKFQKLAPQIPRTYLINKPMYQEWGMDKIIAKAKEVGAIALGPNAELAKPAFLRQAHKEGLLLHFYTVNSLWQMRILHHLGADGVFTDRSDLAMQYFKQQRPEKIETLLTQVGF